MSKKLILCSISSSKVKVRLETVLGKSIQNVMYVCFGFFIYDKDIINIAKVTFYLVFDKNVTKFCVLDVS